jgi:hypothetical protein
VHGNASSAYLHSPQTYSSDYPGRIVLHRDGAEAESIEGNREESVVVNAGFLDEYLDLFSAVESGGVTISNFKNACSTMAVAEAIEQGASYRA